MSYLLVAHGTRKPDGVDTVGRLAERASALLGDAVHVALVNVLGPTPSDVLRALPADRPVTVVPAFLASGYHVRVDLPAHTSPRAVTRPSRIRPVAGRAPAPCLRTGQGGGSPCWRPGDAAVMADAVQIW